VGMECPQALPLFALPQPAQQAAKALEGLLVKAIKASRPAARELAEWQEELRALGIRLPKAMAAVGSSYGS
jgi:hypothetical protein